jgi:hypothetical protein
VTYHSPVAESINVAEPIILVLLAIEPIERQFAFYSPEASDIGSISRPNDKSFPIKEPCLLHTPCRNTNDDSKDTICLPVVNALVMVFYSGNLIGNVGTFYELTSVPHVLITGFEASQRRIRILTTIL